MNKAFIICQPCFSIETEDLLKKQCLVVPVGRLAQLVLLSDYSQRSPFISSRHLWLFPQAEHTLPCGMTPRFSGPETMIRYLSPSLFPSTRNSNLGGRVLNKYTWQLPFQSSQKTSEEINDRKQPSQGTKADLQDQPDMTHFCSSYYYRPYFKYHRLCIYPLPNHRQNALKSPRHCIFTFHIFMASPQVIPENFCSWLKTNSLQAKFQIFLKLPEKLWPRMDFSLYEYYTIFAGRMLSFEDSLILLWPYWQSSSEKRINFGFRDDTEYER